MLVGHHHHVLLESEVPGPGPGQVEDVLLSLEPLGGEPVDHDDPRAPAAGVQPVPGPVDQDLRPVVGGDGGEQESLGESEVPVLVDPAERVRASLR